MSHLQKHAKPSMRILLGYVSVFQSTDFEFPHANRSDEVGGCHPSSHYTDNTISRLELARRCGRGQNMLNCTRSNTSESLECTILTVHTTGIKDNINLAHVKTSFLV